MVQNLAVIFYDSTFTNVVGQHVGRDAWCVGEHGAWCMVHGAWSVVRGAWCTVHCAKCVEHCARCSLRGTPGAPGAPGAQCA